jgi:RES domain-containing protein
MPAYRIGDPTGAHPVYSAEGVRRVGGRWHERGDAVIYASRHYSTAMLEKLVHWNGQMPPGQHFIELTIPAGTSYEVFPIDHHPDWIRPDGEAARRYGHAWYERRRSAVLIVPSVVARMEENLVINADHPEAGGIEIGLERRIWWDERLFGA